MSEFNVWDRVEVVKGRLKGEKGVVQGFSDLNMRHVVIVRRENKRARNKTLGFRSDELKQYVETGEPK